MSYCVILIHAYMCQQTFMCLLIPCLCVGFCIGTSPINTQGIYPHVVPEVNALKFLENLGRNMSSVLLILCKLT